MMSYKEFMTKVVKISILYWPEILMQEFMLSELISSLDQREKPPSIIMEEPTKFVSLVN
jgi:hypothetical protein